MQTNAREDVAQVVCGLGRRGARGIGRDNRKVCHGQEPVALFERGLLRTTSPHLAATAVVRSAGEMRTPKRSHQIITVE